MRRRSQGHEKGPGVVWRFSRPQGTSSTTFVPCASIFVNGLQGDSVPNPAMTVPREARARRQAALPASAIYDQSP